MAHILYEERNTCSQRGTDLEGSVGGTADNDVAELERPFFGLEYPKRQEKEEEEEEEEEEEAEASSRQLQQTRSERTYSAAVMGSAITLTSANEEAGRQLVGEHFARGLFREWPNDAGFDGLTETRGPVDLVVRGRIPAWAAGSLYRTGPGACKVEDTKSGTLNISHWFDGLAHTHRFDIVEDESVAGGIRVQYSSRRQSEVLEKGHQRLWILPLFIERSTALDNVGVTVNADVPGLRSLAQGHKDSGYAILPGNVFIGTDAAVFAEIDPKTMERLGIISHQKLHKQLRGPEAPAHGQRDPETGDYISFNADFGRKGVYRVFLSSAETGKTTILASFTGTPAYIHSFFLTRNFAIICVPSSHLKLGGAKVLWEGSIVEALQPFDNSLECHWYVIDRRLGKGLVGEFASPAGFFFHSTNSFEDDEGNIICELVAYPSTTLIHRLYYDVLLNRDGKGEQFLYDSKRLIETFPGLVRYKLLRSDLVPPGSKVKSPLPSPSKEWEIPAPHVGELPTINPAYACRRHRFVYSLIDRGYSTLYDGIAKTDTQTREVLVWSGPTGHTPGEAIFVPRPSTVDKPSREDDGVLLSVVLDGYNRTSYLICLDARTMEEVGQADCNFAVGFGFHGQHITGV
ncbi:carotenoid cleavage dioxygenase [Verticillium alfalfae VaMs.102]|uniref:Carotenoid cleavage dioxygenase n=1 Tax=Verticillium alfalfae (strain VaMs.102 / ATCC MYA-4576 / FGSC 10136) TaxID=526221 RepID=C9SRS7_VERA1|nr:carotenoid cleavage dioxygenase [Verticillium alfalfae VaMs.102]EEY21492.1 carotenoid cleavage dioxygenase [Verticillium alfalfae VaMs.102]